MIFERFGADLILGLPETQEGYIGILLITEYLTKFPHGFPIKSKTAQEIAEKLFEYIVNTTVALLAMLLNSYKILLLTTN